MKSKKVQKRLETRRKDYADLLATRNSGASKVQLRKDNGGFHRPGSMQNR